MEIHVSFSMTPFFIFSLRLALLLLVNCKHNPIYPTSADPTKTPINSPECDHDTVYFQNDVLPILISNCTYSGYHSEPYGQDCVILSSYAHVMQSGEIKPGRSDASDLYTILNESREDKRMPPPPYTRLNTEQIEKVRKWINQGAINNQCEKNTADCDTLNVPFSTIQNLLNANCIGCHSSGRVNGGVILDTYVSIRLTAGNGSLIGAVTHAAGFTAMPPSTSLSACNILKIEAWVRHGVSK